QWEIGLQRIPGSALRPARHPRFFRAATAPNQNMGNWYSDYHCVRWPAGGRSSWTPLHSVIPLQNSGLPPGTRNVVTESMSCKVQSRLTVAELGRQIISGRARVENPIIVGSPVWREQPPWVI